MKEATIEKKQMREKNNARLPSILCESDWDGEQQIVFGVDL